jgi:hypothetical protein
MTGESRPILGLGGHEIGTRASQPRRDLPRLTRPSVSRQGERLSPQFRALSVAFENERATVAGDRSAEIDPELVVVFDLAGSVEKFRNAVQRVEGFEFLAEYLDESDDPDDDFYLNDRVRGPIDSPVPHSLQVVMSNSAAITQLIRLFGKWQANPEMVFERGLTKFRYVFEQLRAIRRWGPNDRVRETGLMERWRDTLEAVGGYYSPVLVEIELWFRQSPDDRAAASAYTRGLVSAVGGVVKDEAQIVEIAYHSLLVQLPIQEVETVVTRGADSIRLLNADQIMFVSPYSPMSIRSEDPAEIRDSDPESQSLCEGLPRIALLDGLPHVGHARLSGRLIVDDPDGIGEHYATPSRHHGTTMASLIIHGDLSESVEPMTRPLYVRPIMRPHEFYPDSEQTLDDQLFTDLLHRSIRRMIEGESGRPPSAPSVRVVNLSIGNETRALVRGISPAGRLLDWLAVKYNLLFIVSAGNHLSVPLKVPAEAVLNQEAVKVEVLKSARTSGRLRKILPPADAMNALTVGAVHADSAGQVELPDTVWDLVEAGAPSLYGAVGPGVGRSVKPELHHDGGRALYVRPVEQSLSGGSGGGVVDLTLASTSRTGPGMLAAAPASDGSIDRLSYSHGTSNATALVTREADRIFDLLEGGAEDSDGFAFPDPSFHPLLTKALLVHSASWGDHGRRLQRLLDLDSSTARREITALLGYGRVDGLRLGNAASNRAVLIAGSRIGRDERHTYNIPLPASLRSKAVWHRFTVTLASLTPTVGHSAKYREAKVFFPSLNPSDTGGGRLEADHNAVRRGTCQHEIFDGDRALTFVQGDTLPLHIECMDHAQRLPKSKSVQYALVVSIETAPRTSQTIHDEVRTALRERARAQARERIRSR